MDDGTDVQLQPLLQRLDAMLDHLEPPRQSNSLVHNSSFSGFATGIAVASCVATLVLMIAFMIIENRSYAQMDARLDQIKAWSDVNAREIARLQAAQKEKP